MVELTIPRLGERPIVSCVSAHRTEPSRASLSLDGSSIEPCDRSELDVVPSLLTFSVRHVALPRRSPIRVTTHPSHHLRSY
jgi:hypothetical protein